MTFRHSILAQRYKNVCSLHRPGDVIVLIITGFREDDIIQQYAFSSIVKTVAVTFPYHSMSNAMHT